MSPNVAPRIRIEDLPALETLTEEEMAQIFGAGKYNRVKLGIEALEGRELLAAQLTASLSGGVLRVEGTPGNDLIRILLNDGLISVEGIGIQSNGATLSNVNAPAVQRILVDGLAGDDHVWLGDGAASITPILEVEGGPGRDLLHSKGTTFTTGSTDGVLKVIQSGTAVYSLHTDGRLLLDGINLNTEVTDIAAAANGGVYVLKNSALYSYSAQTNWVSLNTEVDAIASASGGGVYVLKNGCFYSFSPATSWVSLNTEVDQIAEGPGGGVYVLKNGCFYSYSAATNWVSLNTEVDQIAPASGGGVYVLKNGAVRLQRAEQLGRPQHRGRSDRGRARRRGLCPQEWMLLRLQRAE